MGFGGFCVIFVIFVNFVYFNGSVVAFVLFYHRVGVVLLWLCVFFFDLFCGLCLCPCGVVGCVFVFVVHVLSCVCLCDGLWRPCLGQFMMCVLYVVLALV